MLDFALFQLRRDIVESTPKVFETVDDALIGFQLEIGDRRFEVIIHFIAVAEAFLDVFLHFLLLFEGALDHAFHDLGDAHPQGFVAGIILAEKYECQSLACVLSEFEPIFALESDSCGLNLAPNISAVDEDVVCRTPELWREIVAGDAPSTAPRGRAPLAPEG